MVGGDGGRWGFLSCGCFGGDGGFEWLCVKDVRWSFGCGCWVFFVLMVWGVRSVVVVLVASSMDLILVYVVSAIDISTRFSYLFKKTKGRVDSNLEQGLALLVFPGSTE